MYPDEPHTREDFDNIDVNLDTDIHNGDKMNQQKQMAIAAEIAAADNVSEFDDDNLQDDIPIDDDYDDEDGIISDNYENFNEAKQKSEVVEEILDESNNELEQQSSVK